VPRTRLPDHRHSSDEALLAALVRQEPLALAEAYYRSTLDQVLESVEFPDSSTMVYHMKEPYGFLHTKMYSFSHYRILPRELNEDNLARTVAIGTGHRILDNRQDSVAVDYRKNPDYWRGDPFIERWHYPIIPEYANRYAQFLAGHVALGTAMHEDGLRTLHARAPHDDAFEHEIADQHGELVRNAGRGLVALVEGDNGDAVAIGIEGIGLQAFLRVGAGVKRRHIDLRRRERPAAASEGGARHG
jgi:hypothetical protein